MSLRGHGLELLVHALTLGLVARLLALAGLPLATDDLWWHLSLGEAYRAHGPWLAADPVLHTATQPPDPAAWLSDVILFSMADALGLEALRVLHVMLVAGVLGLLWNSLRRASGSRLVASVGTSVFVALAAYRLFQLRPELASILATLVLYRLLLEEPAHISRRRVALGAALCLLWANLHAGFLIGPLWIALGALALALQSLRLPEARRVTARRRSALLAVAGGLALLATLANPSGLSAHLVYARAGDGTPTLEHIADEWVPFSPLRLPNMDLPPSPLAWGLACLLLVATLLAAFWILRRHAFSSRPEESGQAEWILVVLSLASVAASLIAVRFLWLFLFPSLLLARLSRSVPIRAPAAPVMAASLALALLVGFVHIGDGRQLARDLRSETYGDAYAVRKYYAHAVWFLLDAGVEGNLYNAYHMGGFLGFWLAPRLCVFVNGSLNVPGPVIDSYRTIQRDAGYSTGVDVAALLERHDVDLFVGVGLPYAQRPGRPWRYTTSLLERAPGWMLVFRSLRSSVYLRRSQDNRENLQRIRAYYARLGVPFDPERGFDAEEVIRAAPRWAEQKGLRLQGHAKLLEAEAHGPAPAQVSARNRLAAAQAAVGSYENAVALDRRSLAHGAGSLETRRRLLWSLLRLDRVEEAQALASRLAPHAAASPLTASLIHSAELYASLPEGPRRDALVAMHPVFTRSEAAALTRRQAAPELRAPSSRRRGAPPCGSRDRGEGRADLESS